MNAEFLRIASRDKKAFLSDQCKEIKENNRMGKTRDLVKKIRDTKRIFHGLLENNMLNLSIFINIKLLRQKRWMCKNRH